MNNTIIACNNIIYLFIVIVSLFLPYFCESSNLNSKLDLF
jgi:hypothetical protein